MSDFSRHSIIFYRIEIPSKFELRVCGAGLFYNTGLLARQRIAFYYIDTINAIKLYLNTYTKRYGKSFRSLRHSGSQTIFTIVKRFFFSIPPPFGNNLILLFCIGDRSVWSLNIKLFRRTTTTNTRVNHALVPACLVECIYNWIINIISFIYTTVVQ